MALDIPWSPYSSIARVSLSSLRGETAWCGRGRLLTSPSRGPGLPTMHPVLAPPPRDRPTLAGPGCCAPLISMVPLVPSFLSAPAACKSSPLHATGSPAPPPRQSLWFSRWPPLLPLRIMVSPTSRSGFGGRLVNGPQPQYPAFSGTGEHCSPGFPYYRLCSILFSLLVPICPRRRCRSGRLESPAHQFALCRRALHAEVGKDQ